MRKRFTGLEPRKSLQSKDNCCKMLHGLRKFSNIFLDNGNYEFISDVIYF